LIKETPELITATVGYNWK